MKGNLVGRQRMKNFPASGQDLCKSPEAAAVSVWLKN